MLYFLHISLKPVCLSHPECFYLTLDWGLATASTWGQAYPFDRWPPSAVASDCSPGNVRHRHVEGWRPATMLFLTTCIQVWMVSSTIHILNTFAITPQKKTTPGELPSWCLIIFPISIDLFRNCFWNSFNKWDHSENHFLGMQRRIDVFTMGGGNFLPIFWWISCAFL